MRVNTIRQFYTLPQEGEIGMYFIIFSLLFIKGGKWVTKLGLIYKSEWEVDCTNNIIGHRTMKEEIDPTKKPNQKCS